MPKWEYRTLLYGPSQAPPAALRQWQYWLCPWPWGRRRWVITTASADAQGRPVGESERSRFIGRIWQALRLLETALKQLDAEGWELVSTSFSGVFTFYGVAVLRRPIAKDEHS